MKNIIKKKCIISVLSFTLLSGCKSGEIKPITNPQISGSPFMEAMTEMAQSDELLSGTEMEKGKGNLTPADIDNICDGLFYLVYNCKDGSQIIQLTLDHTEFYYYKFMPCLLADGTYNFFRKLTPSYEVSYGEGGSVEIPLSINDSAEFQFALRDQAIIFFDDKDDRFNQEYSLLDYKAQEEYRLSLVPDPKIPGEELRKFLKNCVYNGNISVLDELYKLIPEDNREEKYQMELAASHAGTSDWSEQNPYQPEIFFSESSNLFPQREILEVVAESLQTGESLDELGCEKMKSNFDWEGVWKTVTLSEGEEYPLEVETNGIYKYDLNGDGLMEILFLFPGGSMGNEPWEIIFLDEEGNSSDFISGEGMSVTQLYCYNQHYFFLCPVMDFNDKEFLGWNVCAVDKNKKISNVYIYFEKIGSENVFADKHVSTDDFYYLDCDTNYLIDTYKKYNNNVIGIYDEPEAQVRELFQESDIDSGIYGKLDINNDGVEDWTKIYMFFPTNKLQYYCNYYFLDGKTQEFLDLSKYFSTQNNRLCCLIPYRIEDKNHFFCVCGGPGNYIVKLIEIKGMEPVEIVSWFVSVKKRINIRVSAEMEF